MPSVVHLGNCTFVNVAVNFRVIVEPNKNLVKAVCFNSDF